MSKTLFVDTIEKHYRELMRTNPNYRFAAERPEKSVAQIRSNASKNRLAYDGPLCQAACAELGIESSFSAVRAFLKAP